MKQLCNTIGGDPLLHILFERNFNRNNIRMYDTIELKFYKRKYEKYI